MPDRNPETFDPAKVSENEIYRFLTTRALSQNQLVYTRVQTMLTIEVAALAASVSAQSISLKMLVLGLATLLITIFWLLARRDRQAQLANIDILDRVHKPLCIMLIPAPKQDWQRGMLGVTAIFSLMLLANLIVAVDLHCTT